jgi:6-pyruvoyltetrahydropterin/6-carboxytetrahydropterin synthase
MYELKVTTHFAAAHQLAMVAKKCENLHGHNWKIEVRIQGENVNEADVLIDFGELKAYLADIIEGLDHRFLNELDFFKNRNPSSESIARYIAETLQKAIGEQGKVSSVSAWESETACATYMC